jgi:hypothetical protein
MGSGCGEKILRRVERAFGARKSLFGKLLKSYQVRRSSEEKISAASFIIGKKESRKPAVGGPVPSSPWRKWRRGRDSNLSGPTTEKLYGACFCVVTSDLE